MIERTIITLALAALGCGDDATPPADAGDAGTDSGAGWTAEIPWIDAGVPPIDWAPCPDGWRSITEDGVSTCEPFAAGGPSSCEDGEAHFLGEAGCRPIGSPCPAGDFNDDLPIGPEAIYVLAGADPGGDGSRAAPFDSLSRISWLSVSSGATIAIGKGTYEGTLPLRAGVTVVGACARDTILTGLASSRAAVVTISNTGEPATVTDLSFVDTPQPAVFLGAGHALALEGVAIDGASQIALVLSGLDASLTLRDVVVRRTSPSGDGRFGRAIDMLDRSRIEVTNFIAEENHDTAVFMAEATSATFEDVIVRNTLPRSSDGRGGRALGLEEQATLVGTRMLFEGNTELGALIEGAGTSATLSDVIIRDMKPLADDQLGRALAVQFGARLEAERILIEDLFETGIHISEEGTEVVLTDTIIRDIASQRSDGLRGRPIAVQDGAQLSATRLMITRGQDIGIYVSDGSSVSLTDVAIGGITPREADGTWGRCLSVERGSVLTGLRTLFSESSGVAVVSHTGAAIDLENAIVSSPGTSGVTATSAELRMTGFEVRDAGLCGVFVSSTTLGGPPTMNLSRGVVSGAAIGACIQVDGFDLDRLSDDVVYRGNRTNLDITMLPVPALSESAD